MFKQITKLPVRWQNTRKKKYPIWHPPSQHQNHQQNMADMAPNPAASPRRAQAWHLPSRHNSAAPPHPAAPWPPGVPVAPVGSSGFWREKPWWETMGVYQEFWTWNCGKSFFFARNRAVWTVETMFLCSNSGNRVFFCQEKNDFNVNIWNDGHKKQQWLSMDWSKSQCMAESWNHAVESLNVFFFFRKAFLFALISSSKYMCPIQDIPNPRSRKCHITSLNVELNLGLHLSL